MSKGDVHIIPVDDLKDHDESQYCHCEPRIEPGDYGKNLVIHNSYDGRELTEPDNISVN